MKEIIVKPKLGLLLALIVVAIVLDQFTKFYASSVLDYGRPVEVLPVLNWTLLHNYGAAFSFLSDAGGWQRWFFTGISSVVSVIFLVWMTRLPLEHWLMRFSLAFIVAGAIGNLIDRVLYGYVVDFISVHWENNFFPAFNIADMAITFGAMLMILDMFLNPDNHK